MRSAHELQEAAVRFRRGGKEFLRSASERANDGPVARAGANGQLPGARDEASVGRLIEIKAAASVMP